MTGKVTKRKLLGSPSDHSPAFYGQEITASRHLIRDGPLHTWMIIPLVSLVNVELKDVYRHLPCDVAFEVINRVLDFCTYRYYPWGLAPQGSVAQRIVAESFTAWSSNWSRVHFQCAWCGIRSWQSHCSLMLWCCGGLWWIVVNS